MVSYGLDGFKVFGVRSAVLGLNTQPLNESFGFCFRITLKVQPSDSWTDCGSTLFWSAVSSRAFQGFGVLRSFTRMGLVTSFSPGGLWVLGCRLEL